MKSGRGGSRKGSGRKPDPNKKVKKSITIRPGHLEWIEQFHPGEKVSAVIDKALEKWISLDN